MRIFFRYTRRINRERNVDYANYDKEIDSMRAMAALLVKPKKCICRSSELR